MNNPLKIIFVIKVFFLNFLLISVFFAHPHDTEDGYDYTFQVNYLGQFLLTYLLLPALRKYQGSRIVNMSSRAHFNIGEFPNLDFHRKFEDSFNNRFEAYQYSKLCLVMFSHVSKKQKKSQKKKVFFLFNFNLKLVVRT